MKFNPVNLVNHVKNNALINLPLANQEIGVPGMIASRLPHQQLRVKVYHNDDYCCYRQYCPQDDASG